MENEPGQREHRRSRKSCASRCPARSSTSASCGSPRPRSPARFGFDVEEIEDLRVAVDELASVVIEAGSGARDRVHVLEPRSTRSRSKAARPSTAEPVLDDLTRQILSVVVDDFEISARRRRRRTSGRRSDRPSRMTDRPDHRATSSGPSSRSTAGPRDRRHAQRAHRGAPSARDRTSRGGIANRGEPLDDLVAGRVRRACSRPSSASIPSAVSSSRPSRPPRSRASSSATSATRRGRCGFRAVRRSCTCASAPTITELSQRLGRRAADPRDRGASSASAKKKCSRRWKSAARTARRRSTHRAAESREPTAIGAASAAPTTNFDLVEHRVAHRRALEAPPGTRAHDSATAVLRRPDADRDRRAGRRQPDARLPAARAQPRRAPPTAPDRGRRSRRWRAIAIQPPARAVSGSCAERA